VWSAVITEVRVSLGLSGSRDLRALVGDRLRRRSLLSHSPPAPTAQDLALRSATQEAIERVTGESVFIDSSRSPSAVWTSSHVSPIDVIHLVRDPRAVAFSESRPKRADPLRPSSRLMPQKSVWKSSIDWMREQLTSERVAAHLRRSGTGTVLSVRYEDLVHDTHPTLQTILGALPKRPPGVGRTMSDTRHAVWGNPMRFEGTRVMIDERWLRDMPAAQRRLSTMLTVPMRWRYRYPSRITPG
jgi:hypothetical protein